ncbi:purine/pyrimidine permease [Bacillus spongiae]|uniref:Purine/pyrimidine permease n=1 Tax=Bacillus spongiae TaxID=2683610 RepID=A0ABU8HJ58_9BACI
MNQAFTAIQWMIFMLAAAIVAPIAIGELYGFEGIEKAAFVQRTMFVLGVAGILQGLIGHRYPINEGPAGLWWGIFLIYAGFAGTIYASTSEVLQYLQAGMLISGILFILLSTFGFISALTSLFTPTVTFVYLLLLIIQLSGAFMNGMLGVNEDTGTVDGVIMVASTFLLLLTFYFSSHRIQWIQRYSVILSLLIGWASFSLLGKSPTISSIESNWISFPGVFVWGLPKWDAGMIVTGIFLTLLLTTNLIASIRVMEHVVGNNGISLEKRARQGGFVSGINQLIAGTFSAIGSVPISGAAGFVATTGIKRITPFILGSGLVVIVSLLPHVMNVFASIPPAVGYTVTFAIFTKMLAMAFSEWKKESDLDKAYTIAGPALLAGIGVMFVPSTAFTQLPTVVVSVLNNGLILGTLIAIVVEQLYMINQKRKNSV